jgi:murein DD-endopeptidase MepM/ murein hydrolase activator NlpD
MLKSDSVAVIAALLALACGSAATALSLAPQNLAANKTSTSSLALAAPASIIANEPLTSLPAQTSIETATETASAALPMPSRFVQTERIRRSETLASLLGRLGANDQEFMSFVRKDPIAKKILQLQTGRMVQAEIDEHGRVVKFNYRLAPTQAKPGAQTIVATKIAVIRQSDKFFASTSNVNIEKRIETRSAEVQSSFFAATDAAGIPDSIVIRLADILGTEVDFQRDIRRGDKLRVVYEALSEEGGLEAPIAGRILAVEMTTRGKRHEAVWFDKTREYFNFTGRSLNRAFLRNPLEFTRVSSGFTESRQHPIFKDWRAHKGVDFSAPLGTKVKASGTGIVDFVGKQGGYGNVVIIKHPGKVTTLYAHLNSFENGIAVGHKVQQGDIVGEVGRTGWATGPHLHYEFKIDNVPTDPLGGDLPIASTLSSPEKKQLSELIASMKSQLEKVSVQKHARFE